MVKRKNQSLIDLDSSDFNSDLDSEFFNLSKKKNKKKESPESVEESASDSGSDSEIEEPKSKRRNKSESTSSHDENKKSDKENFESEEIHVSDFSDSSEEEFNDGYDDQLMGDEEDTARLASLTEGETKTSQQIEERVVVKTTALINSLKAIIVKRKNQPVTDLDSSNDSHSDLDSEFLNLAKKSLKSDERNAFDSGSVREIEEPKHDEDKSDKEKVKSEEDDVSDSSDLSEEDEVLDSLDSSEEEFNNGYEDQLMGDEENIGRLDEDKKSDKENFESEESKVSDSSDSSEEDEVLDSLDSSEEEFDDGYDDQLMGDMEVTGRLDESDEENIESEESKLSDSSDSSEEDEVLDSLDSSEEEFNDDQFMGDEEDRGRLASLIEKERNPEIFKRIEQRELMKRRQNMDGTLCWEDVSDLPIFKCKICKYRLQYPVMEVLTFGYICRSCYERSAYTNVFENTDIERILSKLCIPCKYSKRGCSFDGSFQNTSKHERLCTFRDKPCPFSFIEKCEMTGIFDIVEHIKKEHKDYLSNATVEKKFVTIEDPMEAKCIETNPNAFYLIEFETKYLLLHNRIDDKQQTCNFRLYKFDDGYNLRFGLVAKHESLVTISKKMSATSYADIIKPCPDNVLTLRSVTLANLGCTKHINIVLDSRKSTNISESDSILTWCSCAICHLNIIDEAQICTKCKDVQICNSCYEKHTTCSKCFQLFKKSVNIYTLSPDYKIKCEINGCNQVIRKDEYKLHRRNCKYKTYKCIFAHSELECKWSGVYTDLPTHLLRKHGNCTSLNEQFLFLEPDDRDYTSSIIKNNIPIVWRCKLTTDKKLFVKICIIGPTTLDNLYVWELHLKDEKTLKSTIISRVFGSFDHDDIPEFDEIIDVSNYVTNNKLNVNVCIKLRDL